MVAQAEVELYGMLASDLNTQGIKTSLSFFKERRTRA